MAPQCPMSMALDTSVAKVENVVRKTNDGIYDLEYHTPIHEAIWPCYPGFRGTGSICSAYR